MNGQADRVLELNRLRDRSAGKSTVPFVAMVSGKGGTGKSFLALNAAYALAAAGRKVLLVDYNLQNPNLHIMSNIFPDATLAQYFQGSVLLEDIIQVISPRLSCIFGDPQYGTDIRASVLEQFFQALQSIAPRFDLVLFDTGPGIHESLTQALPSISTAFIVANPEPTSVMDAYVMAKYLLQPEFSISSSIVINRCISPADGESAYQNFSKALGHFLKKTIPCAAIIPSHKDIYQSIMQQEILLRDKPDTSIRDTLLNLIKKISIGLQVP